MAKRNGKRIYRTRKCNTLKIFMNFLVIVVRDNYMVNDTTTVTTRFWLVGSRSICIDNWTILIVHLLVVFDRINFSGLPSGRQTKKACCEVAAVNKNKIDRNLATQIFGVGCREEKSERHWKSLARRSWRGSRRFLRRIKVVRKKDSSNCEPESLGVYGQRLSESLTQF